MSIIKNPDLITVSVEGVVTDPVKKANKILAYYLRSIHSQSTLYLGMVKSMSHDIADFGKDPNSLAVVVQEQLSVLYNNYFQGVDIKVRAKDKQDGTYTLIISGKINDGSNIADLKQVLEYSDGVLKPINEVS